MNKKGFTLVELLAVIVVLAVISAIAFPIVGDIIDNSEEKAYEQQIKIIEKAAKSWVNDNIQLLVEIDSNDEMINKSCYIALNRLKYEGYLENVDTINPTDDNNVNNYVVELNYDESTHQYSYDFVSNIDTLLNECGGIDTTIKDGTAVYFNPETKSKCTSAKATVATGTKTGCMKWYAFGGDDNPSTINLILAHNTTKSIMYNSTGDNTVALEAATQLANDTATWDSSLNPRFITVEEILKITKNTTFNVATATDADWFYMDNGTDDFSGNSKYCWLFEYSAGCDSFGCNKVDADVVGYWTSNKALNSDPEDTYKYAWAVYDDGSLSASDVKNDTGDGIRPVITVEKSLIYNY